MTEVDDLIRAYRLKRVRDMRQLFARFKLEHGTTLDKPMLQPILQSVLQARRDARVFLKRYASAKVTRRIIAERLWMPRFPMPDGEKVTFPDDARDIDLSELGMFSRELYILRMLARDRDLDCAFIKKARAKMLKAKESASITAGMMKKWAELVSDADRKRMLIEEAELMEKNPEFFTEDSTFLLIIDFSAAGQKGSLTAFCIRHIDSMLRPDISNRDALIRDLMGLLGTPVTSQLVRSTRLQGQT